MAAEKVKPKPRMFTRCRECGGRLRAPQTDEERALCTSCREMLGEPFDTVDYLNVPPERRLRGEY